MKWVLWGSLVFSICSTTFAEKVAFDGRLNGYRTVFLDTGYGNAFHVGTYVPTGMAHDERVHHAGLSHLIEHQVFRRTEDFEDGEAEFNRIGRIIGGERNAYTSVNRTAFFLKGHPDGIEEMVRFLGSIMCRFAPEEVSFNTERDIVIEEAMQYLKSDAQVLYDVIQTELLPEDHPLNKYSLGLPEQLDKINIDTALDFYYANYLPSHLAIFVTGNFSKFPQKVAEVQSLIAQHFRKPEDRRTHRSTAVVPIVPGPERKFPRFVDATSDRPRIVEISGDRRMLRFVLELPGEPSRADKDKWDILFDVMNLELPGSFIDQLKNEGLIIGGSTGLDSRSNLHFITGWFNLTEQGSAERYEVMDRFFSFAGRLHQNGISDELFQDVVRSQLESVQKVGIAPHKTFQLVTSDFEAFLKDPASFLDFKARLEGIRPDDLRPLLADHFNPSNAFVSYMGPDVEGDQESKIFKRSIQYVPHKPLFAQWKRSAWRKTENSEPFTIDYLGISIPTELEKPVRIPGERIEVLEERGLTLVSKTQEVPFAAATGVVIHLQNRRQTLEEAAAWKIYGYAFGQHYRSELEVIGLRGIVHSFSSYKHGMFIKLEGDIRSIEYVQNWFLPRWRDFTPSQEDLAFAKAQYVAEAQSASQAMSARVASKSQSEMSREEKITLDDEIAAVKSISSAEYLRAVVEPMHNAVDFRFSSSGAMTHEELTALAESARTYFPTPLTAQQRVERKSKLLAPTTQEQFFRLNPKGQSGKTAALVRLYGPFQPDSDLEMAVSGFLETLLSDRVMEENRARRGLGYVHQVSTKRDLEGDEYLEFIGQTTVEQHESDEELFRKIQSIEEGWELILNEIREEYVTQKEIDEVVLGQTRESELAYGALIHEADARDQWHRTYGDPHYDVRRAEVARKLNAVPIRDIARAKFSGQTYRQLLLASHSIGEKWAECHDAIRYYPDK